MTSRRVLKAAEAIREVVSMAILTELRDPRVKDVTVTRVEVSADMRLARIHVSVMGDETHQRLTLRGLESARGFLQNKVADRIDTRYTPRIEFHLDDGVKKSIEIARILSRVLPKSESAEPPSPADAGDATPPFPDQAGSASPSIEQEGL
jgi:ribosome-binding factor A